MAKQDRVVAESVERVDPVVPMYNREIVGVFLTGLVVGLVVGVMIYLLNRFVFGIMLCRGDDTSSCASAPQYAMIVSMILGAIAGLIALVQTRVYRPLLAVLGTTVGLWGINELTAQMTWYWALVVIAVLFGLSYALFTWVARIRSFVAALIVTIVLVVLIRLVMTS